MVFNSHAFVFAFLPLTTALYFLCSRYGKGKTGKWFLTAMSLLFVGCTNMHSVIVLLASIVINFCISRLLLGVNRRKKTAVLVAGIILNVAILSCFKYSDQLKDSWPTALLFPLGISFYTFQQIAYLVNLYTMDEKPLAFGDYALSVCFFTKMAEGPITSCTNLAEQFDNEQSRHFCADNFAKGLYCFSIGLAKKVMLADFFGKITDYGYGHIGSLNSFEAVFAVLSYTFQIYYDFSGYCDMAAGIGWMFNIKLPQNFNSPYKAYNISEFWKRWHMTLTQFLTRYIYIPLGGNRKGMVRTCVNILIVYLISGVWHGNGTTFIFWGVLHGIAMILYRLFRKPYERIPVWIKWMATFVFINVTWVFFRAESIADAMLMLRQIFVGGWAFTINAELTETLLQPTFVSAASRLITLPVVLVLGSVMVLAVLLKGKNSTEKTCEFKPTVWNCFAAYVLLLISLLSLSGVSTFLYTNF